MNNLYEKELVIVKVGTNTLVEENDQGEQLDHASFESIGNQVREMPDEGISTILVSSGAITAGLIDDKRQRDGTEETVELQRYAERGWDDVVQKWKATIGSEKVSSALLTKSELEKNKTRDQALGVISCCLSHGDIFIINENDVISDDEIKFGDNDTLAVELAVEIAIQQMFKDIKLVYLTDVDGVYKDVKDNKTLLRHISYGEPYEHYARGAKNTRSKGGMVTKLAGARLATYCGIETFIANGRADNTIKRALGKEIGTYFPC